MWRVKEEKPNIDLICSPTCIKTCKQTHMCTWTYTYEHTNTTDTHTHTPRHACTLLKFKIMVKNETNYSHHNSELYINLKFTSYWSPVLLKGRYNKLYGFLFSPGKRIFMTWEFLSIFSLLYICRMPAVLWPLLNRVQIWCHGNRW